MYRKLMLFEIESGYICYLPESFSNMQNTPGKKSASYFWKGFFEGFSFFPQSLDEIRENRKLRAQKLRKQIFSNESGFEADWNNIGRDFDKVLKKILEDYGEITATNRRSST